MKSVLLLFIGLVFMNTAWGEKIKVPPYLSGVYKDITQKNPDMYTYEVKGKFSAQPIEPRYTENKTIEDLSASIVKSYLDNNPEKFKSLFTPGGLLKANKVGEEAFKFMWNQFRPQKEYELNWYFKHGQGVIASWKAKANADSTFYYAEQVNGKWFLEYFSNDETDLFYQNVVMYLKFSPLQIKKAEIIKDFRLTDKELSLAAQVDLPILTVLIKEKDLWRVFTTLTDNQVEKVRYKDYEAAKGIVKINFNKDDFPDNKKIEMLILQSSFPIHFFPLSEISAGQIKL